VNPFIFVKNQFTLERERGVMLVPVGVDTGITLFCLPFGTSYGPDFDWLGWFASKGACAVL
jgi:hypothetical protein